MDGVGGKQCAFLRITGGEGLGQACFSLPAGRKAGHATDRSGAAEVEKKAGVDRRGDEGAAPWDK